MTGGDFCDNTVIGYARHNAISLQGVHMTAGNDAENAVESLTGSTSIALFKVSMLVAANVSSKNLVSGGNDPSALAIVNSRFTGGTSFATSTGNDAIAAGNITITDGDLTVESGAGTDAVTLDSVNVGSNALSVAVGPGNLDLLFVVNCAADTEDFSDTSGTGGSIIGASNHFTAPPVVAGFARHLSWLSPWPS